MKVIIDIPKEEYGIIKNYKSFMPWAEGLIKKGVAIPEGATNGDMIKAIFPNAIDKKVKPTNKVHFMDDFKGGLYGIGVISLDWWNAPYKGVEE